MGKKYRHWKVEIKEVNSDTVLTPELHGDYEYNDVIEFFGLKEPGIEWYRIKEI